MSLKLATAGCFAAAAALVTVMTAAAPAGATDWRSTVDSHYDAVEETRYVPRGDNPQWGFTLSTVVSDMAWRQRTARMLRTLPRPASDPDAIDADQLADRPEPPTLRFAF